LIPLLARSIAVDLPMPVAPPVITATFCVMIHGSFRFAASGSRLSMSPFWLNPAQM
jgi:hypothetical protein